MGIESVPRLSWSEVCARRLARHGLAAAHARPAAAVAAMAGTHAQVMSAAELAIGLRTAGATRADVRTALWDEHTLVKTFGPRGTVHVLPSRDLPTWVAALSAVPPSPSPFPRLTGRNGPPPSSGVPWAAADHAGHAPHPRSSDQHLAHQDSDVAGESGGVRDHPDMRAGRRSSRHGSGRRDHGLGLGADAAGGPGPAAKDRDVDRIGDHQKGNASSNPAPAPPPTS